MRAPSVTPIGSGFNFTWADIGLRVMAERLKEDGSAELEFYLANRDGGSLLHTARVSLLSTNSIDTQIRKLKRKADNLPWDDILTQLSDQIKTIARKGEPVEEIWPAEDDKLTPSYLLEPILYLNHPGVIFGDYGSLKSLLALATAYVVQLPYYDNTLGLVTANESNRCLYLDYEDDPSSFRKRWSAIERGFGKGTTSILYRRMTSPLADSVESVQQIIDDKSIGLLIVDSLGPAARGNLNDPEPAIKYHTALRHLGITSLTLAHTAKDTLTRKRTIFGSVFFTNLARSVWECKAEQEIGEEEAIISLKHTKANLSRLHPPLGFRFNFSDNKISVGRADLKETGLSGELPLSWQIKNILRRGGISIKELAESLSSSEDTVGRTLRRMRSKNEVIKLEDDTWGLSLL
jgi:hypothetical protein